MQAGDIKAYPQGIAVTFNVDSNVVQTIQPNHAVILTDNLEVGFAEQAETPILGVALSEAPAGGLVDVLLTGSTWAEYTGPAPTITSQRNALSSSSDPGKVQRDEFGAGAGVVLSVDEANNIVHFHI